MSYLTIMHEFFSYSGPAELHCAPPPKTLSVGVGVAVEPMVGGSTVSVCAELQKILSITVQPLRNAHVTLAYTPRHAA